MKITKEMDKIKVGVERDNTANDVMITFGGSKLVYNINNFFDTTSVITFIPNNLVGDFAIQLAQVAEDIQREKEDMAEIQVQKYGEERRESTPLEKEEHLE